MNQVSETPIIPGAVGPTLGNYLREHGHAINKIMLYTFATADLPAGSADMDNRMLVENAGAGAFNLILYAGGLRFRISGGAAF